MKPRQSDMQKNLYTRLHNDLSHDFLNTVNWKVQLEAVQIWLYLGLGREFLECKSEKRKWNSCFCVTQQKHSKISSGWNEDWSSVDQHVLWNIGIFCWIRQNRFRPTILLMTSNLPTQHSKHQQQLNKMNSSQPYTASNANNATAEKHFVTARCILIPSTGIFLSSFILKTKIAVEGTTHCERLEACYVAAVRCDWFPWENDMLLLLLPLESLPLGLSWDKDDDDDDEEECIPANARLVLESADPEKDEWANEVREDRPLIAGVPGSFTPSNWSRSLNNNMVVRCTTSCFTSPKSYRLHTCIMKFLHKLSLISRSPWISTNVWQALVIWQSPM